MRTDKGQTDMTKLTVAFRNFAKKPKSNYLLQFTRYVQWRTEGGGSFGDTNPQPEIPKALQNHTKLNPIVKTVKKNPEFRAPTPQDVRKKQ